MKILSLLTALLFGAVCGFANDGKVRSIDIYVTPYYSANAGKVEYVKVYDKIDELLKSGKEEDFKKAEKIVQDAPQMVSPITLFVLSARAYDLGLRDDAVFWFYAAKNRAILLAISKSNKRSLIKHLNGLRKMPMKRCSHQNLAHLTKIEKQPLQKA